MAKGYVRSSHMAGNDPACGTKLFRTDKPQSSNPGPNFVPAHSYGSSAKAPHHPRAGSAHTFPVRSKPHSHGGDKVGS